MDEQDFSSLSTLDKIQHKSWKARVSAYEELTRLFAETSDFYTFEPHFKKMVTDTNAIAQEAALSAILEYVRHCPHASNSCENVISNLVEKCFGAVKMGTKQKATEIVLLYAEVDQPNKVIEYLIPGTIVKQPKVVAQTVITLKELVRQFGINKFDLKTMLRLLPKLFGHVDKNVRSETFALTVEIYRWLGQSMMSSLSGLKPVQLKELEEAFQKLPTESPTPARLIRADTLVHESAETTNEDVEMDYELDEYDLVDPVDITVKLPGNFYELLASKKWQERKEALDSILNQAKTPKIMDKDYSELISALAIRINDTNALLVGLAASCIKAIAQGLRENFGKYKSTITPPMMEKLKERKPAILEQLVLALNAVFSSVSVSDWLEDVALASKHKNPQVRSECLKLLSGRLKEIKTVPGKVESKAIGDILKKALEDADSNVREGSAEGLGTMMKLLGEKAMLPWTDSLDDIKKAKIKEFYDKANVKASAKPALVSQKPTLSSKKPALSNRLAASPAIKKSLPPKEATVLPSVKNKPLLKKPSLLPTVKKDTVSSSEPIQKNLLKRKLPIHHNEGSALKKPALNPSRHPPKQMATEEIKYKFSQEDAEARATEYIPESIYKNLQEPQWKLRLPAIESLCSHIKREGTSIEPEIVTRSLSKRPGWKEMNFQVMGKMFYCIQLMAQHCQQFDKACAALCIPAMVEKLGDNKLKAPAGQCLVVMAEKISLQFVLSQAYPVLKSAKSPKVLSDALLWVHSCLMDFGTTGLQTHDLVDLVKFALGNTNVTVRTSAVTLMGALRQYIGPEARLFVEDVSPALLNIIDAEFDKVLKLDSPQPTKGLVANMDADSEVLELKPSRHVENVSSRVDISGQLNKVVAECENSNWKTRKEGLDKVQRILSEANNYIKPTIGVDFPEALKQRLNDSNKILQIQAIEITGLLALAMGKPFEKYLRTFAGPVVGVLSDSKPNVRAAGIATLNHFKKTCGMGPLTNAFGAGLANELPSLRKELLTWLSASVETAHAECNWTSLISPLFSCIQDRNADVRRAAHAFFPLLVSLAGHDIIYHKASELKTAERQIVMPLIEPGKPAHAETPVEHHTAASPSRTRPFKMPPSPRAVTHMSGSPVNVHKTIESSPESIRRRPIENLSRLSPLTKPHFSQRVSHIARPEPMRIDRSDSDEIVSFLASQIKSGDPQESIDALKHFDKLVRESPHVLLPILNTLIDAITVQIRIVYSSVDPNKAISARHCKHLTNALTVMLSNQELAHAVSQEALYRLLQELAHRLLDKRMIALETNAELSKAINTVTVKILVNGRLNTTLSVLINLLDTCTASISPADSITGSKVKYTELIMKCLWKSGKAIQEGILNGQLNPDELVYDINKLFTITPPVEWKRRSALNANLNDMPLRTLKYLLLEVVNCLGDSIFDHLTMIQDPERCSIYPYILHMVGSRRRKWNSP